MVWRAAPRKCWGTHKLWAESLSRTAVSSAFGQVILALCSYTSCGTYASSQALIVWAGAYYWAVLGTTLFSFADTALCAQAHSKAEQRAMTLLRWRKIRYAFFAIFLQEAAMNHRGRTIEKRLNGVMQVSWAVRTSRLGPP